MKLKVGDYITCINTGRMTFNNEVFAIQGKQYRVTHVTEYNDHIQIHSEIDEFHNWYTDEESFSNYFTTTNGDEKWKGSVIKFNFI